MRVALFVIIAIAFVPLVVFWGFWFLLVVLAWGPRRRRRDMPWNPAWTKFNIDILIPAHNEQAALPGLLESLKKQNAPEILGAVVVVADHCTDQTADIARSAGFIAMERNSGPPGKPGALREGLAFLRNRPHGDAVLFIDADCVATDNLLGQMAWALGAGHPVSQSAYVLQQEDSNGLSGSVRWGFALKNVIRPIGLDRLGLPCQLFGTGMMMRYDVLEHVKFEDHLVEDLRMSHSLLLAGVRPKFLPQVTLVSAMPVDESGLTTQRLRWEGGQFETWKSLPSVAARLLARGNWRGLLALVDWSAPPLAMAAFVWFVLACITGACVGAGLVSPLALACPALSAVFLAGYLVVGITAAGNPGDLWLVIRTAPRFLRWKLQVYGGMFCGRRASTWQRTPRAAATVQNSPATEKPV